MIFQTNVDQKLYFHFKTGHMNITLEFNIFDLSLNTKFQLKQEVLIFETKLIQNGYLQFKTGKVKIN